MNNQRAYHMRHFIIRQTEWMNNHDIFFVGSASTAHFSLFSGFHQILLKMKEKNKKTKSFTYRYYINSRKLKMEKAKTKETNLSGKGRNSHLPLFSHHLPLVLQCLPSDTLTHWKQNKDKWLKEKIQAKMKEHGEMTQGKITKHRQTILTVYIFKVSFI